MKVKEKASKGQKKKKKENTVGVCACGRSGGRRK